MDQELVELNPNEESPPIEILSSDSQKDTHWNDENTETIRNWKESIAKSTFIYQVVLEKYKKTLKDLMHVGLIFGVIQSVVSGITSTMLSVDEKTYRYISIALSILTFLISIIINYVNGRIKLYELNDNVTCLSNYIIKADEFYFKISTELSKPKKLREDAIKLITEESNRYLKILNESPEIDNSDYKNATKEYYNFLEDDTAYRQYFDKIKKEDGRIEIV